MPAFVTIVAAEDGHWGEDEEAPAPSNRGNFKVASPRADEEDADARGGEDRDSEEGARDRTARLHASTPPRTIDTKASSVL